MYRYYGAEYVMHSTAGCATCTACTVKLHSGLQTFRNVSANALQRTVMISKRSATFRKCFATCYYCGRSLKRSQLYGLVTHEEGPSGRLGGEHQALWSLGPRGGDASGKDRDRIELLEVCMSVRPRLINKNQSSDTLMNYY